MLAPVFGDILRRNLSYFEPGLSAAGVRYRVAVRGVDGRGHGTGGS